MTRLYGGRARRAPGAAVPHGHWRTTTFIAGLRQSGVIAPLVLDGPNTGAAFRAYVERRSFPPSNPVTWWSWTSGRAQGAGIEEAIALAGPVSYLPPYSPDLIRASNSSPSSSLLRKAAARTKESCGRHRPAPRPDPRANAATILLIPDTNPPNSKML